jgi:hypothetical protein
MDWVALYVPQDADEKECVQCAAQTAGGITTGQSIAG